MRPQQNSVAKEKSAHLYLIKAQLAVNSELFARDATQGREILIIFTRYPGYAEISVRLLDSI